MCVRPWRASISMWNMPIQVLADATASRLESSKCPIPKRRPVFWPHHPITIGDGWADGPCTRAARPRPATSAAFSSTRRLSVDFVDSVGWAESSRPTFFSSSSGGPRRLGPPYRTKMRLLRNANINSEQLWSHGGLPSKNGRPLLDFSTNLNPLGPPVSVLQALRRGLPDIARYPDTDSSMLVEASAKYHRV